MHEYDIINRKQFKLPKDQGLIQIRGNSIKALVKVYNNYGFHL